MIDPLDLAGLIVSRLCHDLSGPVGALVNGAELLVDEPDPEVRAEFTAMIGTGAAGLGDRLAFARFVLGASGPSEVPGGEARRLLEAHAALDGRLRVVWAVRAATLPRDHARLLLVLAWVLGGWIEGSGELTLGDCFVEARAARLRIAGEQAALLSCGPVEPAGSATALALVARLLAERTGSKLRLDDQPGCAAVRW